MPHRRAEASSQSTAAGWQGVECCGGPAAAKAAAFFAAAAVFFAAAAAFSAAAKPQVLTRRARGMARLPVPQPASQTVVPSTPPSAYRPIRSVRSSFEQSKAVAAKFGNCSCGGQQCAEPRLLTVAAVRGSGSGWARVQLGV